MINNPNVVLEFNGCAFHGCTKCFRNRDNKLPKSDLTAEDAYQATMKKQNDLEDAGFHVVTAWECDVRQELRENPEMKAFFVGIVLQEPLEPRDAFYGG